MFKRSSFTAIAAAITISGLVFFNAPKPARAFFDPFEIMIESTLTAMNSSMNTLVDAVLRLSDDIGIMADRILLMADNIGIMADRIVTTEELLADVVTNSDGNGGITDPLLTSPLEGDNVSLSTPAQITISTGDSDFVLYFANTSDMNNSTNIMVLQGDTSAAWDRLAGYTTGDKLYMAVRVVENGTMGPASNTVMVNLVP